MARHNVAAQTFPGPYPTLPVTPSSNLTETPVVVADGMYTALLDNKTVVLVHNTHATDPQTVTFTSSLDAQNRTGDITAYSLIAGAQRFFGPFKTSGWVNAVTQLWIDASDATVLLAVITLT